MCQQSAYFSNAGMCTGWLINVGYCAMRPTVLETMGADANYTIASFVALMVTDSTTTLGLATSYNSIVHFREVMAPCCNWWMIHQLDHFVWIVRRG